MAISCPPCQLPAATDLQAPSLLALPAEHVAEPLRKVATQAGWHAAIQGGVLLAVTPSPALDGVLAALRGLPLIRQVAAIHGLVPGTLATLALLRRAAWTAASVPGGDQLLKVEADRLGNFPRRKRIPT